MNAPSAVDAPDRNDMVYRMPSRLKTAVRVALATGRPLLLRGEPGSGKSSLARYIAASEGWRYYEHVVTARTQARDLLWTFDSVRRLSDAQVRRHGDDHAVWQDFRYVEPGALWWAFAPESARRRGFDGEGVPPEEFYAVDPFWQQNEGCTREDHAVVLIDEIDKADPDLPNGLLVPLGAGEFHVSETGKPVRKEPPRKETAIVSTAYTASGLARHLVVVTTNEERELPQAFLRRCVVAWLPEPKRDELIKIAEAHQKAEPDGLNETDEVLAAELADALLLARKEAKGLAVRAPSTAEFLDAFRACRRIGVRPGHDDWDQLRHLVLVKTQPAVDGESDDAR